MGRNSDGNLEAFIATLSALCPADFDKDGARDVHDLMTYINTWLAKDFAADFNGDNTVDVADLFGYINAWLVGC